MSFTEASVLMLGPVAQNQRSAITGKRPLERVAELTEGCTGSDLFEICSQAASIPLHEHLEAERSRESFHSEAYERCAPLDLSSKSCALGSAGVFHSFQV